MNKWRRFRRLSPAERGWLVRAFIALPVCRVLLRLAGFRPLQSMVSPAISSDADSPPAVALAEMDRACRAARMVAAASREGLCRANCLEQSVTLLWLLRRQKISGQLRIGVRKQGELFEAHAWVELGGVVLNDGADVCQRYRPFRGDLTTLEADYR